MGLFLVESFLCVEGSACPSLLQDNGESFTYTGSGGRDLSGNKRTAEQSCDQKLTNTNRFAEIRFSYFFTNSLLLHPLAATRERGSVLGCHVQEVRFPCKSVVEHMDAENPHLSIC